MKRYLRLGAMGLALLLTLSSLPRAAYAADPSVTFDALTILFTHDTHDHFLPDAADVGGYTRLAAVLKKQRENAPHTTITLDAGDFSMGSLFQTAYATDAPELRALGAMGYDVTTLGNHEFDYRQQGLAHMLNAAKQSGDPLPAIVQANYTTPEDPASAAPLLDAFKNYPVTPYTVIEKPFVDVPGGKTGDKTTLRIAVFGLMGLDSHECAPMSGMVYEPIIDAAKRTVAEIQARENPDYIICLSHSGTEDGEGEDYELAKAVDGIDVIISGHTHTTLSEPIQVNGTLIVSCGPYTKNLGVLTVGRSGGDGSIQLCSYRLIPIDGSVPAAPDMTAMAEGFKGAVEQNYLSRYSLGYDEVLTRSGRDFTIAETGDLIGNAYISAIREIEGDSYVPIAFAVAPDGVIRDQLRAGEMTTADAFDILSLGSGADGTPAYPLVSVYLTGKDLKNAFEVDASISQIMPAAELFGAGCGWNYNPHRMFLDRVTACSLLEDGTGRHIEIENDRLYRVVADLYSGQMLGTVESKSFGLLTVTPRDEKGDPVTDLESRILHDREGNEVKAWYALASYLKGQTEVKLPYPSKAEEASWNPLKLLFPMGLPTLLALTLGLAVVALAVFLLYRLATRKRRRLRMGYRPYRG